MREKENRREEKREEEKTYSESKSQWVRLRGTQKHRQRERVDNQQVLSSFHPCGRALLSIVMGCLPSWADELMSGFNANLLNWHTARQGERRRSTAMLPLYQRKDRAQLKDDKNTATLPEERQLRERKERWGKDKEKRRRESGRAKVCLCMCLHQPLPSQHW